MSQRMKYFLLIYLFISVICFNSHSQVIQADMYSLNLGDPGKKIENVISLNISNSEYEALQSNTGEKYKLRTNRIIINGDTLEPKEISTRGQSSLMFKRKSLGFRLKSEASFRHADRTESLNKFSLISLAMDKYYCRNRLAFEMMEEIGIFNLFYSFCDLRINGRSEGIFMIIEQPEDWALRKEYSPLVIRRGYNHSIDKTKTDNKTEQAYTKKYLSYYRQIYKSLNKQKGEELYKTLSEWIDMDFYMKWVAFNFLVHNGDYSDEVFFYIDPEIKKYRIIPWDYDDIFAIAPHEGKEQSKEIIGDKLLYSSEDKLDEIIATDPYLYEVYLKALKEVLNKLPPVFMKKVFENSYAELYPFYSNQEIISHSQFDYYKDANMKNLKNYMLTLYSALRVSRDNYLEYLQNRNN
jgi:spore coat protein H